MKSAATIILMAATCLAVVWTQSAGAQQSRSSKASADQKPRATADEQQVKKSQKQTAAARTREHTEQALEFAREHHPELASLVSKLQKGKPAQFKSAIRHLVQSQERLQRIQLRSPERYELALEAWKLDSRIRLLAARMTMSDDPELEAELKTILRQRTELRLQQLSEERDRLKTRLERIEENIARIESDPEAAAARDLERVKRNLAKQSSRGN